MLNQHMVETPENISFGYPVAGIGSRFLAILVDSLIQGSLYLLLIVVLLVATLAAGTSTDDLARVVTNSLAAILIIAVFLIQFGYFILAEVLTGGQSPGKNLMRLRVIKENGSPLTPVDSIIRNLIRIVDFMPIGYAVGVLTMMLNDRAKRLGDYAVGTLVVRVSAPAKLEDIDVKERLTWNTGNAEIPNVERLKEEEIEIAESFLQRRYEIETRQTLGREIAQLLATQLQMPETPDNVEEFLAQVIAAYRHRQADEPDASPVLSI